MNAQLHKPTASTAHATRAGTNVIAVPDGLPGARDMLGAVTYWSLHGGVPVRELAAVWAEEGLDAQLLPPPPSPVRALKRAVKLLEGRGAMVRPLGGKRASTAGVAGVIVVHEVYVDDRPTYRNGIEVSLVARPGGAGPDDLELAFGGTYEPEDERSVRAHYARCLATYDPSDIGPWLIDRAYGLKAVALRVSGGVYFVPRSGVESWSRVARAVEVASGHTVFQIPSLTASEAIAAVTAAVTEEVREAVAKLEEEIDKREDSENGITRRGIAARKARVAALEEKLAAYRDLLGAGFEALTKSLETVGARLTEAALALDGGGSAADPFAGVELG